MAANQRKAYSGEKLFAKVWNKVAEVPGYAVKEALSKKEDRKYLLSMLIIR
jgi:hypothetical protein